jgi:hypothetical protein
MRKEFVDIFTAQEHNNRCCLLKQSTGAKMSQDQSVNTQLYNLVGELAFKKDQVRALKEIFEREKRRLAEATAALSEAQGRFDKLVETVKDNHPEGTSWAKTKTKDEPKDETKNEPKENQTPKAYEIRFGREVRLTEDVRKEIAKSFPSGGFIPKATPNTP